VTELVHGASGVQQAKLASDVLFGEVPVRRLSADEIVKALPARLQVRLPREEVVGQPVTRIAVSCGAVPSRCKCFFWILLELLWWRIIHLTDVRLAQARQVLKGGGLHLNGLSVGKNVKDDSYVREKDLIEDKLLVLRVGKGVHRVVLVD
jgi:tyrosyl-tRNA synthetase